MVEGNILYLDCVSGFPGVYRCQNVSHCIFEGMQFIFHRLYFNKFVEK